MSIPRYLPVANLFLYVTSDYLTGSIPAPDITCFVVRSDEKINSNMADPPLGRIGPL